MYIKPNFKILKQKKTSQMRFNIYFSAKSSEDMVWKWKGEKKKNKII